MGRAMAGPPSATPAPRGLDSKASVINFCHRSPRGCCAGAHFAAGAWAWTALSGAFLNGDGEQHERLRSETDMEDSWGPKGGACRVPKQASCHPPSPLRWSTPAWKIRHLANAGLWARGSAAMTTGINW
ncbi:hypothetical protein GCM10012319_15830 [Comamonas sp. KCTC 72670]|nr:hypothetical protein GCM10012319_15830 [Comamonas sp. KCTC 72670]